MSKDMTICGLEIKRGTKLRTMLPVPDTMTKIPLTVINGVEDGPTLLITAGIHGGEYPGIAAAIELGRDIEPEHVHGCLIILHPVNIQGFWARREFIVPEDGKNLNRVFPGTPLGTLADKTRLPHQQQPVYHCGLLCGHAQRRYPRKPASLCILPGPADAGSGKGLQAYR